MKVKALLSFIVLQFACGEIAAQTNFLPGYYVTPRRDTIRGMIERSSENRNYKFFVFKNEESSKRITLYPKDAIAYGLGQNYFYERKRQRAIDGDDEFFFYRVLEKSKITLLLHESEYYIDPGDGTLVEITKRSEITEGKITNNYVGMGRLRVYTSDCESFSRGELEAEYRKPHPNYLGLVRKYNDCMGSPRREIIISKPKPHVDFGLLASVNLTQLTIGNPFSSTNFDLTPSFNAGVYGSLFIPNVDERFRFVAEITYTQYKGYAYFGNSSSNNDLFIDYSAIKVPIIVRRQVGSFFFELGMQNQFLLSQSTRWRKESFQGSGIFTTEPDFKPLKSWTPGFLAGAGYTAMIGNRNLCGLLRYSECSSSNNFPIKYRTLEFFVTVQLTRRFN